MSNAQKRGPRPLAVHVGLALTECARQAGATAPQMEQMLAGIRKYQDYPFFRNPTAPEPVYTDGELALMRYPAKGSEEAPRLLLIPSLINKSYILDLMPEKSFAKWLAGQGTEVWLLDWGTPTQDEGMATLGALISRRLAPAIRHFAEAPGRKFVLGYCMGGTLLGASLSEVAEAIDGAVFLASPWDFHAGDKGLADRITIGAPSAIQMINSGGRLPMGWIQSVFAAVNTQRAMDKFMKFAGMEDGADAELFVAVEDWLNDGLDLPGEVARECIVEWYGRNNPPKIGKIEDMPVLIVASEGDRLVPAASSLALKEYFPDADILEPGCGHIGMMTGKRAETGLWKPLADWIKKA